MKLNKTQTVKKEIDELVKEYMEQLKLKPGKNIRQLYDIVQERKKGVRTTARIPGELLILISALTQYDMTNVTYCDVVNRIKKLNNDFIFMGLASDCLNVNVFELAANVFYKCNPWAVEMDRQLNSILNLLHIKSDPEIDELINFKYEKFQRQYGRICIEFRTPAEKEVFEILNIIRIEGMERNAK